MATSKKQSSAKETVKSESASKETLDHGLKVAPSMPYYCTWMPGACPAENKAANAQTLLTMMPPMCPPPGAGAATIVPTFVPPCPTMPVVCVPTINPVCPVPGAQVNAAKGAQTATIITCTGIHIVCGPGAQAQTIIHPTQTMCQAPAPQTVTGIPFVCHQGAAAQAQTVMVPPTSHAPPYCPAAAQAQTIVGPTAYQGCNTATTTVQPSYFTCPPAGPQTIIGPTAYPGCIPHSIGCPPNAQTMTATTTVQTVGAPAQAQGTIGTISAFPPACLVTALAHCFTAATCAAQAQTIMPTTTITTPQGAQAQTVMPVTTLCFPPSIGCPPNAQAQTIVPTPTAHHTYFACPPTGPIPTATTTVQTGVGTPAQAQGTIGTISAIPPACLVTAIAHCFTAATCAAPAQAKAQTIWPTTTVQTGAGAQTIINPTTHPTANTMCFICPPPTITGTIRAGGAQAQAVTLLTAPPNCGGIQTNILPVCNPIPTNFCPYTAQPGCGGIQTNICPTAAPNCTGIHTNACTVGAQAQAAFSPTTTVAHRTLATVCTQTGPVNTIVTLHGCPRPTIQTQIGCVTQPPICFYTTITQPIGQCPPVGTGPQPQTIIPTYMAICQQTHPLATCPPLGTAQPQGISGVLCGITNTIVNTTTVTTITV